MTVEGLNPYVSSRTGDLFVNMTLFEHGWAIIFAQCVEFKDKSNSSVWKEKTYLDIQVEMNDAYNRIFRFWDYQGKCSKLQDFSMYYKDIYENTEKYVFPQEELCQILKFLRDQGKFLFIASNSPYPYAKVILDQTLGKVIYIDEYIFYHIDL